MFEMKVCSRQQLNYLLSNGFSECSTLSKYQKFGCVIIQVSLGYFSGIVENLRLMPIYYRGWVMRLYHDFRVGDQAMTVMMNNTSSYHLLYFVLCVMSRLNYIRRYVIDTKAS